MAERAVMWSGTCFVRDRDAGRVFLWLPVILGLGIGGYFALPREPSLIALCALAIVATGLAIRLRNNANWFAPLIAASAIACGATIAKVETDAKIAVKLDRPLTAKMSGNVVAIESRPGGAKRLFLEEITFRRGSTPPPDRVAVSVRNAGDEIQIGQTVSLTARLIPPSGPAQPGSFDFARSAFFKGIGAYGFAYGRVTVTGTANPTIWRAMAFSVADFRARLSDRLRGTLGGEAGAIAAALIVGDRGGISKETEQDLRRSGLAHILAISGLHMALVAGTLFWVLRAILALVPSLALSYPIKKWSAAAALIVAALYLLVSGAGIATQRAFIMTAVAFIAILFDRPALRLRNVAVAALVVMVLAPHSVLEPGFQMSFAAAVSLIAAYEWLALRRWRPPQPQSALPRLAVYPLFYIGGILLTTLIAGMATAPFAAYHFQQFAPYGLVANALAMPIVSLIVMPLGLLAMLVAPFGLDPPVLAAMGTGIEGVVSIAGLVANWTGEGGQTGLIAAAVPILITAGLLWTALWTAPWRRLGWIAILAGLVVAPFKTPPHVIVDPSGSMVAFRTEDGELKLFPGRTDRLVRDIWQRAEGVGAPLEKAKPPGDLRCDALGCATVIRSSDGQGPSLTVAHIRDPLAFREDCRLADIVISRHVAPKDCGYNGAVVLDRSVLRARGSAALYLDRRQMPPAITVEHARGRFPRPWH